MRIKFKRSVAILVLTLTWLLVGCSSPRYPLTNAVSSNDEIFKIAQVHSSVLNIMVDSSDTADDIWVVGSVSERTRILQQTTVGAIAMLEKRRKTLMRVKVSPKYKIVISALVSMINWSLQSLKFDLERYLVAPGEKFASKRDRLIVASVGAGQRAREASRTIVDELMPKEQREIYENLVSRRRILAR